MLLSSDGSVFSPVPLHQNSLIHPMEKWKFRQTVNSKYHCSQMFIFSFGFVYILHTFGFIKGHPGQSFC